MPENSDVLHGDTTSALAPSGYIIDVCAYCGSLARWPFSCGHRSESEPWTTHVRVHIPHGERVRLQQHMDRRAAS